MNRISVSKTHGRIRRMSLVRAALAAVLLLVGYASDALATGTISGQITDAGTLLGIPGGTVQFYNINVNEVAPATATVDNNGNYTKTLPDGSYAVATQNTHGYINKISNNIPCSATCDVDSITPVVVSGGSVTVLNFALTPGGGRIAGRITSAATGNPIAGVQVFFADSMKQVAFSTATTDGNGDYISEAGSVTGNVYVFTADRQGYQNEAYNNHKCNPDQDCDTADSVAVTLGLTTNGINFVLDLGGRISGTVKDSNNAPLANVEVRVWDSTGARVDSLLTDVSGNFITAGLAAGNYYVATRNSVGLVDYAWNGLVCAFAFCQQELGTPIAVTIPSTTSGINFVLTPGQPISGTVTAAAGGTPLQDVFVGLNNAVGVSVGGAFTNASGAFTTGAVPPGTYYANVFQNGFVPQIYNHLSCPTGCPITNGTPIVVSNHAVTGIDFPLLAAGTGAATSITGTVINGATNQPFNPGVPVQLVTPTGQVVLTATTNATTGVYTFASVTTGSYYVRTNTGLQPNGTAFINQIYNGVTCLNSCSVLTNAGTTPVTVTPGGTTSGINFTLAQGGLITGTVTAAAGNTPLLGISAQVFNSAGVSFGNYNTDASGNYRAGGLPAGTYYVRTSNNAGYVNQLWQGGSCPQTGCLVTTGTPVVVTGTSTTSGINFALALGGRISGKVTDATNPQQALQNVQVGIFSSTGVNLGSANTDASGNYTTSGLPPGSYFLRTSTGPLFVNNQQVAFVDQLYNGTQCVPLCLNPTAGTPVAVTSGGLASNVNFALSRGGSIFGAVIDSATGAGIPSMGVQIYTSAGVLAKTTATNAGGGYTAAGLPPGTYYARTSAPNGIFYLDALYKGMPCSYGCSVTAGTPITVASGLATPGVDFALSSGGGGLSGTITDKRTGQPLPNIFVQIYTASGVLTKTAITNLTGSYVTAGLAPGTYYARTFQEIRTGHADQLYSGKRCASTCTVTTGTPIVVAAAATTSGIDFALGGLLTKGDFDADGRTDIAVWRASTGTWHAINSSNDSVTTQPWGAGYAPYNDVPVPGDYDGDGKTDFAVFRRSTGEWFILRSSNNTMLTVGWGVVALGDIPVPADYDGDGRTDIAVYRTTTGDWFIIRSSNSTLLSVGWGAPALGDIPVVGDYDGDGRADVAVYRVSSGEWFIIRSSNSTLLHVGWGVAALGDIPVVGDYDNDGRSDIAVYRKTTGEWFVIRSSNSSLLQVGWGSPAEGDVPVPGDYDGDGRTDVAVWRPATGGWYVINSSNNSVTTRFWGIGLAPYNDVAVPSSGIR